MLPQNAKSVNVVTNNADASIWMQHLRGVTMRTLQGMRSMSSGSLLCRGF